MLRSASQWLQFTMPFLLVIVVIAICTAFHCSYGRIVPLPIRIGMPVAS